MSSFAIIRLATTHARYSLASLTLVGLICLLSGLVPMLGLNIEAALSEAVHDAVDRVDVRTLIVERRHFGDAPAFGPDVVGTLGAAGLVWGSPLVESFVWVDSADGEAVPVAIEGTTAGDPRHQQAGIAALRSPAAGDIGEYPALGTPSVVARLPDRDRLTANLRRTVDGEPENLPVVLRVVGVSPAMGDRIFVDLGLAAAIDRYASGGPFDPTGPVQPLGRAIAVADDLDSVAPLVAQLERTGWRVSHRLSEIHAAQRTQGLILGISVASVSGFVLAGLVGIGVYVASNSSQTRRTVAAFRLARVGRPSAALILVVPPLFAAGLGAALAARLATLAAGPCVALLASTVGLAARPADVGGQVVAVGALILVPLVVGLLLTLERNWRMPVLAALQPQA